MEDLIRGKVAKILNHREMVINRGAEHGVQVGMRFEILEPEEVITDPDTSNQIGAIQRAKVNVKVSEVGPLYAIAQTFETYSERAYPGIMATLGMGYVNKVQTIRGVTITEGADFDEKGAFVEVGDPVVQKVEVASS